MGPVVDCDARRSVWTRNSISCRPGKWRRLRRRRALYGDQQHGLPIDKQERESVAWPALGAAFSRPPDIHSVHSARQPRAMRSA